jgi:hypothetical protein
MSLLTHRHTQTHTDTNARTGGVSSDSAPSMPVSHEQEIMHLVTYTYTYICIRIPIIGGVSFDSAHNAGVSRGENSALGHSGALANSPLLITQPCLGYHKCICMYMYVYVCIYVYIHTGARGRT